MSILSFNQVYIHIYVYNWICIYMHIYWYVYTCIHSQPISSADGVMSVSHSWQTRTITLHHTATHCNTHACITHERHITRERHYITLQHTRPHLSLSTSKSTREIRNQATGKVLSGGWRWVWVGVVALFLKKNLTVCRAACFYWHASSIAYV